MTKPLHSIRCSAVEELDLVADLRRDLGVDTLFFICAIEAALGVQVCDVELDAVKLDAEEVVELAQSEQLLAELLEEAA